MNDPHPFVDAVIVAYFHGNKRLHQALVTGIEATHAAAKSGIQRFMV
jgi:hypothetical protein